MHEPTAVESTPAPPPLPSLPRRVVDVFFSPAELGDRLARTPRWVGAMVLGAVFVVVASLLIPADIWQEMMRQQFLQSGQDAPEGMEEVGATIFRVWAVVGGSIFWAVWAFLVAGVTTLVFAFLLGDDGRYRQYLAATTHALLIAGIGGLLTVPLRIARRDPQLTLSLGAFSGGDLGTWTGRFLSGLDLFMLWAFVVLAVMVSRIDTRRSVGSAAGVLLGFVFVVTGLIALIPRPG